MGGLNRGSHPPNITHVKMSCTKRQNELYSEVWKLFSQSSIGVPALLPCAMLPRQACWELTRQLTKPIVQFILSLSMLGCVGSPYGTAPDVSEICKSNK